MKAANMRRERNSKFHILIYLVAALLCATLFSMHFVGGLYARYYTRSRGGDSARVAAFRIVQEGTIFQTIEANVTPGSTDTGYTIEITNNSEVTVDYTLKVTNETGNLPLQFKLTPVGDSAPVTAESFENGISTSTARREAGSFTDKYTLTVSWQESADKEADLAYMGMVDYITLSVTVTQVD